MFELIKRGRSHERPLFFLGGNAFHGVRSCNPTILPAFTSAFGQTVIHALLVKPVGFEDFNPIAALLGFTAFTA